MKRPLIAFAIMWAAGIFLELNSFNLPTVLYKPWLIAFIFIIIIVLHTLKNQYLALISVLIAGLFCGILYSNAFEKYVVNPVVDLNKTSNDVSAVVLNYPEIFDESQRLKIKVSKDQLNHTEIKQDVITFIYVPKKNDAILPGDRINLTVSWYIPTVKDGFDRFRYLNGEGIYILAALPKDSATFTLEAPEKRPWWYYPKHLSQVMKEASNKLLTSRQSGFLNAVTLGDTSNLDGFDNSHMRKSGISHVTSVSGLHISFLISFLMLFLGKKYGSIISVGVIIIFIVMVGWSPSVLRAGFMYIIFALSFWINRENDSLTALFAALIFISLTNPFVIFSVGMQLSYTATLGIILFSAKLQRKLMAPYQKASKPIKYIAEFVMSSVSCSLSSMVLTIPILFYSFGYVSVLAPIANLLVLWAVSIVF